MTDTLPTPDPASDPEPTRRSQIVLVVGVTAAALLAALAFLAMRSSTYESTANVLVAPAAEDDAAFQGIPLIRHSSDGTRAVQTGAALLDGPEVDSATARALGGTWTSESVASSVEVSPRGGSDLVAVTASAGRAAEAARVANVYVEQALELRRRALAPQLRLLILRTRAQRDSAPNDELRFELDERLKRQRSALRVGDPTLAPASAALPPKAPATAPAWLVIAVSICVGLLIGLVAVALRRSG